MCVFMCVLYRPRGVHDDHSSSSILASPRLARNHPSIIDVALSINIRTVGVSNRPLPSTVHTHATTYTSARIRMRIRPLVRAFATDARLKARSRRQGQGIARASIASTHRRASDDDGGMYSTMAPVTCHRTMTTTTMTTRMTTRRATIARAGGASQGTHDATRHATRGFFKRCMRDR